MSRKYARHSKKFKQSRKTKCKSRKSNKSKYVKKRMNHRGGNCNTASVREPGFNIAGTGDISGFSIPDSRGAIYRPNCANPLTNQAATP